MATASPAWSSLQAHYDEMKTKHMRDLFAEDPKRFEKFSKQFGRYAARSDCL